MYLNWEIYSKREMRVRWFCGRKYRLQISSDFLLKKKDETYIKNYNLQNHFFLNKFKRFMSKRNIVINIYT